MSTQRQFLNPWTSPRIGTTRRDPGGNRLPGEYNERGERIDGGAPRPVAPNLAWYQNGRGAPNLTAFQQSQRMSSVAPAQPVGTRTGQPLPTPVGAPARPMTGAWAPPPPPAPSVSAGARQWARNASGAPDPAVLAVAGKNAALATPYGSVSSTMATPGQRLTDGDKTDSGVRRLTPLEQVARSHPEIAVAGSAHNREFVDAVNRARANPGPGTDTDVTRIADNVSNAKQPDPTAPGGALYQSPVPDDIQAPAEIGGATKPVMFAGSDVSGSNPWKPIPTPLTGAAAAGQATREAVGSTASAAKVWTDRNVVAPVVNTMGAAANFVGGLFGAKKPVADTYTPSSPSTPTPTPASNDSGPVRLPPFSWSTPLKSGTGAGTGTSDSFNSTPLSLGPDLANVWKPKKRAQMLDQPADQYGT